MGEFISESKASKNALNMANLASTLPVQVLIFGEIGTGKKTLARIVASDATVYRALDFVDLISKNRVNLDEIETVILSNIDKINNIRQFMEKLEKHHIKVIATAEREKDSFSEKFAVRIDLAPLSQRQEDLKILSISYLAEANRLFGTDISIDDIVLDVSKNGISLKKSIYRNVVFCSVNKEQVFKLLERFLYEEMDNRCEYKDLLEVFEIPLITAARERFKSQLQMAQKLNINRNTLRKKINQYNLGD